MISIGRYSLDNLFTLYYPFERKKKIENDALRKGKRYTSHAIECKEERKQHM